MTPFVVVAVVGLASYLFRISMLVLAARVDLPGLVERAARNTTPVSFAALAASAFVVHLGGGPAAIAPTGSAVLAAVAVRRTGNAQAALIVGMPVLWILSALFPS